MSALLVLWLSNDMTSRKGPEEDFQDRRARLFGRQADVEALLNRCREKGFTLISGRPKMGKSWLIEETCRRLEAEQGCLVGHFECPGGPADAPLRAVADAYTRWLSTSSFRKQAASLLERHRGSLVGKVGELVGSILDNALSESLPVPLRLGLEDRFRSLAALDQDLKTGGLKLRPLPYEQARDLSVLLSRLSERRVVLVFDQWEKSADWKHEAELVDTYLRNREDWPNGHVFGVVRTDPKSEDLVRDARALIREWPAAVEYVLGGMALGDSSGDSEAARLVAFVRNLMPDATRDLSDSQLVDQVHGYPGVLYQWTEEQARSEDELVQGAKNAQANLYPDLEAALECLSREGKVAAIEVAIRLALIPHLSQSEVREVVFPLALDSGAEEVVIELQDRGVLSQEALEFPSFGHETRREVAAQWALRNVPARVRQQATQVIEAASTQVNTTLDLKAAIAVALIMETFDRVEGLNLPKLCRAYRQCCRALLGGADEQTVLELVDPPAVPTKSAPLLAMGLLHTLIYAKSEDDLLAETPCWRSFASWRRRTRRIRRCASSWRWGCPTP